MYRFIFISSAVAVLGLIVLTIARSSSSEEDSVATQQEVQASSDSGPQKLIPLDWEQHLGREFGDGPVVDAEFIEGKLERDSEEWKKRELLKNLQGTTIAEVKKPE